MEDSGPAKRVYVATFTDRRPDFPDGQSFNEDEGWCRVLGVRNTFGEANMLAVEHFISNSPMQTAMLQGRSWSEVEEGRLWIGLDRRYALSMEEVPPTPPPDPVERFRRSPRLGRRRNP